MKENYIEGYVKTSLPFIQNNEINNSVINYRKLYTYKTKMQFQKSIISIGYKNVLLAVSLLVQCYTNHPDSLIHVIIKNKKFALRICNEEDLTITKLLEKSNKNLLELDNDLNGFESEICILLEGDYSKWKNSEEYAIFIDFTNIEFGDIFISYFGHCIKSAYIKWFAKNFEQILESILKSELNFKMKDLKIISDEEMEFIQQCNNTDPEYDSEHTIYSLFEQTVCNYPSQTAIIYKNEKVTYKELYDKVSNFADVLSDKYKVSKEPIGIYMTRGIGMIISMLSVLKCGCCYVPLDPDYPIERLKYMIKESGIRYIIEEKERTTAITSTECECIYLQLEERVGLNEKESNCISSDNAYIIFTSGSTGKPKGVVVKHRNIVNTLIWRKKYYQFTINDVVLQLPSFSFDSSVEDIFTALISGATLCLLDNEERFDIKRMKEYLENYKITHMMMLPNYYRLLLQYIPQTITKLKSITLAGEAVPYKLVVEHFKNTESVLLYSECGPTETSVCANVYKFEEENIRILLGTAISNVKCHIVNRWGNLAPVGGNGEEWIESPGTAAYLNNEYCEKFVSPGMQKINKQFWMYKSGDMVKRIYDGNIAFVGRKDNQVKINGYRVEIGEVENQILRIAEIEEAAVIVKENNIGQKYLIAYITGKNINKANIRNLLNEKLPSFMIPKQLITIEKMPHLPNGKVNRVRLLKIQTNSEELCLPQNMSEIEKKVTTIFENVINEKIPDVNMPIQNIGIDSLKLISIMYELEEIFHIRINFGHINSLTTVKNISNYIENELSNDKSLYSCLQELKKHISGKIIWEDGTNSLLIETEEVEPKKILDYIENDFVPNLYPQVVKLNGANLNQADIETKQEILSQLESNIEKFRNSIFEQSETGRYPFSGMQSGHVLVPNRYIGDILIIKNTTKSEKIVDALKELIKTQSLLRSFPKKEGSSWIWIEKAYSPNIKIPIINLHGIEESKQLEILYRIYEKYYYIDYNKEYKTYAALPYLPMIIKKSFNEHYILFFADHLIYDAISYEILQKTFKNYVVKEPHQDFWNYVTYVEEKLQENCDENKLIETLNMQKFSGSIVECYKNISLIEKANRKIKIKCLNISNDLDTLKYSLEIYCKLVSKLTGSNLLPICMLNRGRNYKNISFLDVIGEFIDVVPVLIDTKNMNQSIDNIKCVNEYLGNNVINITSIIFKKNLKKKFSKFLKLLLPIGELYTPNFLKFNYVGYRDEQNENLQEKIRMHLKDTNYSQRENGIVCEVFQNNSRKFEIEISTAYKIESIDIEQIFSELKDQVILEEITEW